MVQVSVWLLCATRATRVSSRTVRGVDHSSGVEQNDVLLLPVVDEEVFATCGLQELFVSHTAYLMSFDVYCRSLRNLGRTLGFVLLNEEFVDWCAKERRSVQDAGDAYVAYVAGSMTLEPWDGSAASFIQTMYWALELEDIDPEDDVAECMARDLLQEAVNAAYGPVHAVVGVFTSVPEFIELDLGSTQRGEWLVPRTEHVRAVLALAVAVVRGGSLVVRHDTPSVFGGMQMCQQVRGWSLRDYQISMLDEQKLFAMYCTDSKTGEPIPPEPGVRYVGVDTVL